MIAASRVSLAAVAILTLTGVPAELRAQAQAQMSALHPIIMLDAYLDYAGLLLTPPQAFDLLSTTARSPVDLRLAAHREFEQALRERTQGVVGMTPSRKERARAGKEMLAKLGERFEDLPGISLLRQGREVWERIETSTDFDVDGFRVRLRMDEAVEGKVALKVQKQLR